MNVFCCNEVTFEVQSDASALEDDGCSAWEVDQSGLSSECGTSSCSHVHKDHIPRLVSSEDISNLGALSLVNGIASLVSRLIASDQVLKRVVQNEASTVVHAHLVSIHGGTS